jgi:hypothetical protein
MMNQSILWRGIEQRGHEACRLFQFNDEWWLEGTAVFSSDNHPCRLSYYVACDKDWNTRRSAVSGWLGGDVSIDLTIEVLDHRWRLNGVEIPITHGCIDLDLNFSPSTNLIPIRRLNLEIGQHAQVKAAWLRFPTFELEPLSQIYTRLDAFTYRYSSDDGKFVRELTVNEAGLVTDYPGLWQAEQ